MMTIAVHRGRPHREFAALRNELNDLLASSQNGPGNFGHSFGRGHYGTGGEQGGETSVRVWSPAVDVAETEHEIVLNAELPGLKKEDIDIQLSGDTLTLRGERQSMQAKSGENFHRIERQYGRFGRTFQIETPIDASGVSASYDDGVLTVRLPKQEAAKPRQIEIKSS
jgi:HSP20 family protein